MFTRHFLYSFAPLDYSPLIFQQAMHVFTKIVELFDYVFYMSGISGWRHLRLIKSIKWCSVHRLSPTSTSGASLHE